MATLRNVEPPADAPPLRRVMSWFFAHPTEEITLNDLCARVAIAKTTANITVRQLVKEGFLEVRILGKLWRIKANQAHEGFSTLKIAENLELVYRGGVVERVLEQVPDARVIVLFGSYRKGDDLPGSDLDIAAEILGNEPLSIRTIGVIKTLGYRRNVPVKVHVFTRKGVDRNLFASIANGIILHGFLEVAP